MSSWCPGNIRTPNILIRSQVLYPVELRDHSGHLIASLRGMSKAKSIRNPHDIVIKYLLFR